MSLAVISGEYESWDQFKTFQQGSEHTDAHHMELS